MRTGTTLSVYATPWSLLTNPMHENRDHSICLYNNMVSSHQCHTWEQGPRDWWEETMVLHRQIEWSLVSCMEWNWWEEIMMLHRQIEWSMVSWIELVRRDHGSICLYNIMVSSHQLYAWDQEPLYLSIQYHGLFSPIPYMWEEIMMLHRQIEWSMVSWIELVRRDHGVV
jgi:hypothetical protein